MKDELATISGEPLTAHQSAVELGVSVHTIRAWLARRRLGYLKLGKSIRIPREEIARILRENYVPALPERAQWNAAKQAAVTAGAARKKAATGAPRA